MRANTKVDIRIVDLQQNGRIVAEIRRVDRQHAIRAVRALLQAYLPDRDDPTKWSGVQSMGWAVQPAVKFRAQGREWLWVGKQTAKAMGVFPKQNEWSSDGPS
jgi:hypothetical protein